MEDLKNNSIENNLETTIEDNSGINSENDIVELDIPRKKKAPSKKKAATSKGKRKVPYGKNGKPKGKSSGAKKRKKVSQEKSVDKLPDKFPDNLIAMIKNDYKSVLVYWAIFAVAIAYWEIIMFIQTGGMSFGSLFFLFFLPAQSLLFAALCGFGHNLAGRITAPVLTGVLAAFYVMQTVYYRNFSSLFSISMVGMGNEALGDFWWALKDTLRGSIGIIILIFLPVIVMIVISVIDILKLKKYHLAIHGLCLLLTIALWFVGMLGIRMFGNGRQSAYALFVSSSANTDTAAKKLGTLTTAIVEGGSYYLGINNSTEEDANLAVAVDTESLKLTATPKPEVIEETEEVFEPVPWIDERIDLNAIANATDDSDLKSLTEFYASREPSYTNEYTGLFEGYNLIYICAEGFWTHACNEEVTPTLYKMANNGIVLNNYYNSMKNTTTNGEFEFITSLWPDVSRNATCGTDVGSLPRSSAIYMPQGIGDLFTAQGIPSYAFHNYYGKYYRRILSWPNLGYTCKFMGMGMNFTSDWPASDLELMQQSVDDYINEDQFHAYYMTFSGHGPYTNSNYMFRKNINEVKALNTNPNYNTEALGYLAGELELDKAMEYLLKRLEEAGKLDNTVIVIAGDHYPYYLSKSGSASLAGEALDENFGIYKSTCIIYNAGLKEPIVSDTYCCNIDIAPTMLNLFNIPFDSRLMMGKDIFSDSTHRAALYNKSFITDLVRYNYETGETVWSDLSNSYSKEELDKYLDAMITLVENEYTASCKTITENIYLHIYKMAGILSEDEVNAELERERQTKAKGDSYNAEDAALQEQFLERQRAAEEEAQKADEFQKNLDAMGLTAEEFEALVNAQQGADGTGQANPNTGAENANDAPALPNAATGTENAVNPNAGAENLPQNPVDANAEAIVQ